MSNVLARFRGTSDCQTLTDARTLRGLITDWAFKEANIPKKYRPTFVPKIEESLGTLVNQTRKAQYCFPTSAEKLAERKVYLQNAINACIDLYQELQAVDDARRNNGGLDLNKLEKALELLESIFSQLKKWKSSNTLQ